jgi:hypothetical protein
MLLIGRAMVIRHARFAIKARKRVQFSKLLKNKRKPQKAANPPINENPQCGFL